MTQIVDAVLFISGYSNICVPIVLFIEKNQLPVSIVRLDSAPIRQLAENSDIHVTSVPSLVLESVDKTVSLYSGVSKCMSCLQSMKNAMNPPPPIAPVYQGPATYEKPVAAITHKKKKKIRIERPDEEMEIEFIGDPPVNEKKSDIMKQAERMVAQRDRDMLAVGPPPMGTL